MSQGEDAPSAMGGVEEEKKKTISTLGEFYAARRRVTLMAILGSFIQGVMVGTSE